MAYQRMAQPWRHPQSGVYYFRRAIPERLRALAGKREFKRSLRTSELAQAKRRWPTLVREFDAYLEGFEATPVEMPTTAQVVDGGPELPERELYALAGQLWPWMLGRYGANPAPPEAMTKIAPPTGPWGAQSAPWSGQRYLLIKAAESRRPAREQGFVRDQVTAFLKERDLTLGERSFGQFCEAARTALDGVLARLQALYRGERIEADAPAWYATADPATPKSKPKVKITGLIETWAKGRENVRQATRDEFERYLRQFSEYLKHDDASAVTGKDLRGWRDHLKAAGYKAKTINQSCLAAVRAVFAAAEAEEVLKKNPFAGVRTTLKEDKTKEKPRRPYLERLTNIVDTKELRLRFYGELVEIFMSAGNMSEEMTALARYLSKELGSRVGTSFDSFFENVALPKVLDSVTLVYRFYRERTGRLAKATQWRDEVRRIFREEQAGYDIDDDGGIHLRVDAAFQFNRVLAIEALRGPRYEPAALLLTKSYEFLNGASPRPRDAIKSAFDSAESLFKLLGGAPRLGGKEAREVLRPILDRRYVSNSTARQAAAKVIESFCEWIDAAHFYRHAPAEGSPAEPPEEVWHLLMSQAAGYVRWLAELDRVAQTNK